MNLLKRIFFSIYKPIVAKKIYRSSIYTWKDIKLYIPAGVFHPKYFFSTRFLLETVLSMDIKNKQFLELGAGSGLISIAAAKNGAKVISTDISARATETLEENAKVNSVSLRIIHSNLFDNIPPQQFDIIAVNPPYYPKASRNELEMAWYCGENFEYFEKLFGQLEPFIHSDTVVLMVLSEDCNLERIFSIAQKNKFNFKQLVKKKFWWEWNMIYKITRVERS